MGLSERQIDEAARLLARARRERRLLDAIPEACRPESLADAYAIQDRLAHHLGWPVAGWFCACTNPEIQRMLGLDEPYYARLFEGQVKASPAVVDTTAMATIAIECEFGFRLARDLPRRAEAYRPEEVAGALAAVHPTVEVVAGHLKDWPSQGVFSVIADNGTDGALVYGPACETWRDIDLASVPIALTVNGEVRQAGSGANILGNPLEAFVWLANARRRDGDGLKAGHIHNTGTATSIYWATAGDEIAADFGPLGRVHLELA